MVIRLLMGLLALGIIGLIMTQFVVPTLKDEQTWWIFKKNNTKKQLKKLYIELASAKDVQEIKEVQKKIKALTK